MNDNKSAKSNSFGASLDSDSDSDSGFFSEAEWKEKSTGAIPFDIIHESEKGWCRVSSTMLRGRRVAIKSLRAGYSGSALYSMMLEKEFELGSRLYHPAIVSYIAMEALPVLGQSIIMEYIDGVLLSDWLKNHREDRHQTLRIFKELCEALSYLHSHGIVHRDLKPSNIMITAAGQHVKLIDLGLAYSEAYSELSFPGGTRHYSAPELLEEGTDAGEQTDIFSLGVIMREMLSYPDKREQRLIEKCLAVNAADRPKSVKEIMEELDAPHHTTRTWLAAAIVTLLIVVGAIMVAMLTSQRQKSAIEEVQKVSKPTATTDTTPVYIHNTVPTEIHSKPYRNQTKVSEQPEETLIEEMEKYARQYTLRELEKHYRRDGDTLPKTSFPAWRIFSELDKYVATKCGGKQNSTYRKAKPIVKEASASTMREFHSRLFTRMNKPEAEGE